MAPEQLKEEAYNKSVDWWAVGIMLYELLFGDNPFNGDYDHMSENSTEIVIRN